MRISYWISDVCSSDLEGYAFQVVDGTTLPYSNDTFDIVVSNHVIEHVGNADAQRHHLDEIRRVLAPDGVVYFAAPNRWRLVEPHFRLRSEEHTSDLQSLMRISHAVFCLKKKIQT